MKSILYVGATLMIGASIYGFVDYNKTRNKKEFKNMYTDKEVTQPVVEKKPSPVNLGKIETLVDDKKVTDVNATVSNDIITEKPIAKVKKQKRRTFSTRLFSRAPLDERYIKEEIKPDLPKSKTEPGKTENKEQ
jgi:phosphopentomutase